MLQMPEPTAIGPDFDFLPPAQCEKFRPVIRTMTPSDCPPLQPLCSEISSGLTLSDELSRAHCRGWVSVAQDAHTCEGFLLVWQIVDEWELVAIGTREAARRKGVAGRLLANLIELGREEGIERITLEVAATNASALTLYRSNGFEVFNVRKAYYPARDGQPRCDALEMERLG